MFNCQKFVQINIVISEITRSCHWLFRAAHYEKIFRIQAEIRPHILVLPHFWQIQQQKKSSSALQNKTAYIGWCLQSFPSKTSILTQNMKRNAVPFTAVKPTSDCILICTVCLADVSVLSPFSPDAAIVPSSFHFRAILPCLRSTSLKTLNRRGLQQEMRFK